MRKTRYMAMQKMLMEQRQEVQSRAHSGVVVAPEEHTPKSAVSPQTACRVSVDRERYPV